MRSSNNDPRLDKPILNQFITLFCPIFDEEGHTLGMDEEIEVEYYELDGKTYIVDACSDKCHPDDITAALDENFKNYERL
jgi:hypothetical protein